MKTFLAATLCLMTLGAPGATQEAREPWSDETLELFDSLPIQDGGRIKPLSTYAGFTMLALHGKRSLKTESGEKLTPVPWLLDTFFYPEIAAEYETFLVQDDAVIRSLGLSIGDKKKRDTYSYSDILPGREKLFQLAGEYASIEEKDRTSVQQQIFALANNFHLYERLLGAFDFARTDYTILPSDNLDQMFEGATTATFGDVVENSPELLSLYQEMVQDAGANQAELFAVERVLRESTEAVDGTEILAVIPPLPPAEPTDEWFSPIDAFYHTLDHGRAPELHLDALAGMRALANSCDDRAAFQRELETFHGRMVGAADASGLYEKVPLEVAYYKSKVLDYSQVLFILAFVLTAIMWLRPKSPIIAGTNAAAVTGATLFLVVAITMRCMIRNRPPVSTLYETVLFVTAVGSIVALFAEAVNRKRIALSAAAILGMIGLFIANGYETLDKRDTMPSLVAVLDTNFWLATHVTAITAGYSAGMLAALLASAYLIVKFFGLRHPVPRSFFKNTARMVYGVLCFGLILSLVGTVLGGIWANDSWGRFWGWDPKENGALLIVLSQLVILHARMGGYLKEHGMCIAAALGGTVIAFSWWGVNLLGVGLHSYGFTSGIHRALWTYYLIQWGIAGLGGLAWYLAPGRRPAAVEADPKDQPLGTTIPVE